MADQLLPKGTLEKLNEQTVMGGGQEGVGPSRLGSKLKACRDLTGWVARKIGEHCQELIFVHGTMGVLQWL